MLFVRNKVTFCKRMCSNLVDPSKNMSRMAASRLARVAVAPKRAPQAVRPTSVHLTGPAGGSALVRRAVHWQSQALPFTTAAVCMRQEFLRAPRDAR